MSEISTNNIEELKLYNNEMLKAITGVVFQLRCQEEEKALDIIFKHMIEGFQWEMSMFLEIIPEVNGIRVVESLNTMLNESIEAIERQDYILLADLFEYEIFPLLDAVQGELKKR